MTTKAKKPTDEMVIQQAKKLAILPGRPDADGMKDIARILKRAAQTEYHLKAIAQHLLETQQFFPTPLAINEAAKDCPAEKPPEMKPADPNCGDCGGTGYVCVQRGQYSGADVCHCRRIVKAEESPVCG
jgi:hypothetical protein